jgi:methionyl-tRNA formyltransferase
MTDLPYGRGGSPLQNLIVRGHKTTKLTAFRMTEDFDAGPVYLKEELTLSGSATEIFTRASSLAAQMILTIIEQHPSPQPQTGEIISFRRRKPEESRIPEEALLDTVYDYIRMLDGEGYPRAFIETGGLRYEFCNAHQEDGKIHADVIISATGKNKI